MYTATISSTQTNLAIDTVTNNNALLAGSISEFLGLTEDQANRAATTWKAEFGSRFNAELIEKWLSEHHLPDHVHPQFADILCSSLCKCKLSNVNPKLELLLFTKTLHNFLATNTNVMPEVYQALILDNPVKTIAKCIEGMQFFLENCKIMHDRCLIHYGISIGLWIEKYWQKVLTAMLPVSS